MMSDRFDPFPNSRMEMESRCLRVLERVPGLIESLRMNVGPFRNAMPPLSFDQITSAMIADPEIRYAVDRFLSVGDGHRIDARDAHQFLKSLLHHVIGELQRGPESRSSRTLPPD